MPPQDRQESNSDSGEFFQWTQLMIMWMNLWTITNDTFPKFPNLIFTGNLSVMMLLLPFSKGGNYELSRLVKMLKGVWVYLI